MGEDVRENQEKGREGEALEKVGLLHSAQASCGLVFTPGP